MAFSVSTELPAARHRLIHTTGMLRVLAILGLLIGLAPSAHAGRGTNLVKYMPDDANVIVIADVARARRSPIFKKVFEAARSKNDALDDLASALAVDKAVDTIAASGNVAQGKAVLVIEGRVDKVLAEVKKQATKEDKHAGVTFWVVPDGEIGLVDKKLVMASPGEMEHVIDRALDKKAKGPGSLRTILASASANSSVFGGMVIDADTKKQMAADLGAEPQWAAFSLGMAQRLTMEARVKCADDAAAAAVVKAGNDKLGAPGVDGTIRSRVEGFVSKDFADSILVDQDHTFARISATMTQDDVDKVLALVKMFM
jgi:hypothetical protein